MLQVQSHKTDHKRYRFPIENCSVILSLFCTFKGDVRTAGIDKLESENGEDVKLLHRTSPAVNRAFLFAGKQHVQTIYCSPPPCTLNEQSVTIPGICQRRFSSRGIRPFFPLFFRQSLFIRCSYIVLNIPLSLNTYTMKAIISILPLIRVGLNA